MRCLYLFATPAVLLFTLGASRPAFAQADGSIELVVPVGRPLRVVLDRTVTVKSIGQPITGTLVEPVYAYDRIVLPAGAHVTGHVAALEGAPRLTRLRAMLGGDFSSKRHPVLQFDSIVVDDRSIPIHTAVGNGVVRMRRQIARGTEPPEADGTIARARQKVGEKARDAIAAAKEKASETIAAIKEPGKGQRLKEMAIDRLPYHPQFLRKGTVFNAELQAPLTFGMTTAATLAPAGTKPAPASILKARLLTALDSAKTPRGTALEAVVTEPVFSADHQLIFPEGTRLMGEVTFAREARRLHRNGQLRFLFERVEPPTRDVMPMLAALHAVDVGSGDHVALDEEGGASVTNSKARFIPPALAILALQGSLDGPEHHGFDGDADDAGASVTQSAVDANNVGGRGVGGFLGFGLIGVGLSQLSHPLAIGFAVAGVARTVYTNVIGKGQELRFAADTPIQVQLAPRPAAER